MSNKITPQGLPRVMFMGMEGEFSRRVLWALLERRVNVCAVITAGGQNVRADTPALSLKEVQQLRRATLPVLSSSRTLSIGQLAGQRKIPLLKVGRLTARSAALALGAYEPDVLCVACFPQRIPQAVLNVARLACLNVHPSLLPANRGPEPLFWTFYQGLSTTGVTIHLLNERLDSGAIVAQEVIPLAEGMTYGQLERACADRGGALLARAVWEIYRGQAQPVPQDESKSSYQGFPDAKDFVVPVAEWEARHVYNFICGVTDWSDGVALSLGGRLIPVRAAISYSQNDVFFRDEGDIVRRDEEVWVKCREGWVQVSGVQEVRGM